MQDYKIGRLNGRFVVSWWEGGRRRRYRLDARSAKEAESAALDLIRRETVPPGSATVADIWGAYRDELGARPTGKTMDYTGIAVLAHFGALRPDQISTDHCRSYTALRRQAGRSDGTIWTELGHLRSALAWARKKRLIDHSVHIERPQKPAPKDRYLSHAEIGRLLDAAAAEHVRLAILIMLSTAARVGAVLDLTWDRVDLGRGQINLRLPGGGPRKGRAVVPINAGLRAALTTARQAALSDHVIEWAGGPVRSIRRGFQSAVTAAGLHDVGPHCLRHTAAVHMAEAGIPMEVISQFLGHSNVQITASVYARFSPGFMADAAKVLDFARVRQVQ